MAGDAIWGKGHYCPTEKGVKIGITETIRCPTLGVRVLIYLHTSLGRHGSFGETWALANCSIDVVRK